MILCRKFSLEVAVELQLAMNSHSLTGLHFRDCNYADLRKLRGREKNEF